MVSARLHSLALGQSLAFEGSRQGQRRIRVWGRVTETVGENEGRKRDGSVRPARPRRQGSGLMRNTLLQAQHSHVNLITPFLGVAAFRSDLGVGTFFQLTEAEAF